jgi:hypothetical protein
MWETIHLSLVIAMVTVNKFSKKIDSRGFENNRFQLTTVVLG